MYIRNTGHMLGAYCASEASLSKRACRRVFHFDPTPRIFLPNKTKKHAQQTPSVFFFAPVIFLTVRCMRSVSIIRDGGTTRPKRKAGSFHRLSFPYFFPPSSRHQATTTPQARWNHGIWFFSLQQKEAPGKKKAIFGRQIQFLFPLLFLQS